MSGMLAKCDTFLVTFSSDLLKGMYFSRSTKNKPLLTTCQDNFPKLPHVCKKILIVYVVVA